MKVDTRKAARFNGSAYLYDANAMARLISEGLATYLSYWNLLFAVERSLVRVRPDDRRG